MLSLVFTTTFLAAGCSKDTDCKGDRICEKAVCVSPKVSADGGDWALPASRFPQQTAPVLTPPPAPPLVEAPPSPPTSVRPPLRPKAITAEERTFPRVVRKPGQVCVQSLSDKGALEERCRPE